jgi:hypothetical protein
MAKSFDELVKRTTTKKTRVKAQADIQISTLRKIVMALGGELEVLARFPKGTVRIDQFDPSPRRTRHHEPGELRLV